MAEAISRTGLYSLMIGMLISGTFSTVSLKFQNISTYMR